MTTMAAISMTTNAAIATELFAVHSCCTYRLYVCNIDSIVPLI